MQGKGVAICNNSDEAESAIRRFGQYGNKIIVEDFIKGFEVSLHGFSDGDSYKVFPVAKDHKTLYEDNEGPMTGGMGMVAPIEGIDVDALGEQIFEPLLKTMRERGTPFKGLLYPGVMLTENGPKVIEFNARFGDPEAEGYLRLLKSSLLEAMMATVEGTLGNTDLSWSNQHVATVALASYGYPVMNRTRDEITGVQDAEKIDGVKVYHACTKRVGERLETSGGRVAHVTATGKSPGEAKERAYQAVNLIDFEGKHFRRDIGSHSLMM
jgi:phosphoribosylamine--glycine ligase